MLSPAHKKTSTHPFQLTTLFVAMMTLHTAYADTDPVSVGTIQVLGVGQAASINAALREQRSSDSISSVVHADGIGQLPDANAAEALQRLPGVALERDQGEGRFVTVRGLGTDLNAVTINGTLVPAPESNRRGVALDVLPSELVQSLAVVKTLTPDMDANSLGGTVQVNSLSAFDHKGLFYTGTAEGSYNDLRDKYSPKFSGAISNRFSILGGEDNFGVAAAVSYQNRKFGSDNVETGGEWTGQGVDKVAMRYYDIERERLGAGLNFDFRTDSGEYYLKTLYSKFVDTESRNAMKVKYTTPCFVDQVCSGKVTRALKTRKETQDIQSYVLGGKQQFGMWTVDAQAGYSRAQEKKPYGISAAEYSAKFKNLSYSNSKQPVFVAGDALYNPSSYTLNSIERQQSFTRDTEKNIKLDLSRDYNLWSYNHQIKFGGKISRREKTNDENVLLYEGLANSNDFYGDADYSLGRFRPLIDPNRVLSHLNGLNPNDYLDEQLSAANDFVSRENINSLYLMNSTDIDRLKIIAGLRYEDTRKSATGQQYNDGVITETTAKQNYHHWLPSISLRYELDQNTLLRTAFTTAVVRPTFAQSSPGVNIDGLDAEFGNPELKALKSRNFDLSLEKYFGDAGVLSASAFYKDINNFIYNTDLAGSGQWADFDEAKTYQNGSSATIYGIELSYSQKMDRLPAPWNGLVWGVNTTLSHSDATIKDAQTTRKIDFPSHSKVIGNVMLGWKSALFGVKVSANYKSRALYEIADVSQPDQDIYNDRQTFVDLSTYYNINKNLKLKFDVANLSNEKYYAYTGERALNSQYEKYGPTYKLALTLTHF